MPCRAGKNSVRPDVSAGESQEMRRARGKTLYAAAAAFLLFSACHLNYEQATSEETTPAGLPDTVAIGLVHKIHKDGRLSLELEAARAETFNADKTTVLSTARFVEYDRKGEKATEGRAAKVVFHTDTENAEISGNVRVHSSVEKGEVTAASLAWENKTKRLTAPPGEQVHISKDDGSFISGSGFVGDFKTRQLTFAGPVEGSYVWKEKK
jgi:LPS export ABC transporter protein LptC